jgi:hypothetical protein
MGGRDLPGDIQERLDTLDKSMTALEQELEPLLATDWDVLTSKLEPVEKAKLNLMIAYAADSLFFLYLKTQVRQAPPASAVACSRSEAAPRGPPAQHRQKIPHRSGNVSGGCDCRARRRRSTPSRRSLPA